MFIGREHAFVLNTVRFHKEVNGALTRTFCADA